MPRQRLVLFPLLHRLLGDRAVVHFAPLVLLFDLILRLIALEAGRLHLPLVSHVFVVVIFHNRPVCSEIIFIPLVDSAGLLIFRNLAKNVYGLLVLAQESGNSVHLRFCDGFQ